VSAATIVIAAHNEEAVIGATLDALLPQVAVPSDIIVSANGCSDSTAQTAASRGVRVIDRSEPGKPGALNAADALVDGFPCIYLDADIIVPADGVAKLLEHVAAHQGVQAVVPERRVVSTASSWPVKAYFAISDRLPMFRTGLFGRGMIVLTREGRERFDSFPPLIADDLFLDSLFTPDQKSTAQECVVTITAPRTTRDLLNRLIRVRRGNAQLRSAAERGEIAITVRPADRWSWLRDVVLREPRLAPASIPYVVITFLAALRARRTDDSWGRDESTRAAPSSSSRQERS